MSKYEALGTFLKTRCERLVPMTFAEIEKVIGQSLPRSQRYPAWWSNNPWNNPMTKVWLDAGFTTEQIDTSAGKVVFRRGTDAESITNNGRHPLIGCMKGTVTIMPGVTLEEAGEEWGAFIDQEYGRDIK